MEEIFVGVDLDLEHSRQCSEGGSLRWNICSRLVGMVEQDGGGREAVARMLIRISFHLRSYCVVGGLGTYY